MLVVLDLVCYASAVPDMVSLFKVCRDFWSISKREQLWATLLRRDFPTHAEVVPPGSQREWFCDLHQYGAYFGIDKRIHLWPNQCLYRVHFNLDDLDLVVMTARNHDHFKDGLVWARKVGVNHVGVADLVSVGSDLEAYEQFEDLVRTRRSEHSKFELEESVCYFTRLPHDMDGTLTKLQKYDPSPWDELVAWLHEHFEVDQIVVGLDTCEFKGKLRKDRILTFHDHQLNEAQMTPERTRTMTITSMTYCILCEVTPEVWVQEPEAWMPELWCEDLQTTFVAINGKPVPFKRVDPNSGGQV